LNIFVDPSTKQFMATLKSAAEIIQKAKSMVAL